MTKADSSQPVGIIVATHGELSQALVATAEMIVGTQGNVTAVCLSPQDSPETFQEALDSAIRLANTGTGVVVLIDLFGGTPGNAASLAALRGSLHVISGVNLPMLIEVLLSRQGMSAEELAAHALESGKAGIIDIAARVREQQRTN